VAPAPAEPAPPDHPLGRPLAQILDTYVLARRPTGRWCWWTSTPRTSG
jgi:DNA mismatch repair protein MutL